MALLMKLSLVLVAVVLMAAWAASDPLRREDPAEEDKQRLLSKLDLVDDDGSVDTAIINYLFAKQMVNRLRAQMDISDLQRKRSYWKQCAFNAVSCFGK